MNTKTKKITPTKTFQVWQTIKTKYNYAIVFVRIEDDYYTFKEDAVTVNQITGIEITTKQNQQQCCILFHQLHNLLPKLVKAGHKIAVCDQL